MAESIDSQLWGYAPSTALAIVGAVLFAIVSAVHLVQLVKFRAWFYLPILLGGVMEVVGFITRILSARSRSSTTLYIVQTLFLLIPPVLFSASIYMTLKKIIVTLRAERHSRISVRRLTPIFVWADVVSLVVQGGGGGLMGTDNPDLNGAGHWIIIGGLAVQLIAFSCFLYVVITFYRSVKRSPSAHLEDKNNDKSYSKCLDWQTLIYSLYVNGALVMIRSIFRVVEFAEGREGVLANSEVSFYIMDSLLMFAVMVIMSAIYAPAILAKAEPISESQENDIQVTESKTSTTKLDSAL